MMKRFSLFTSVFIFIIVLIASTALAATPQGEAQKMVDKAVAFYKANGKDKAVEAFNAPTGQFVKGELFIFMQDLSGVMLAHGANPALVGKDLINLKDSDGKLFVKAMADLAKEKGSGWVEYKWTNPVSKKIEKKITYVKKVDNYFIGCGVFK
jgi:hypothetical protein